MNQQNKWYRDQGLWLEVFVLANLGGLSLDIYIAHSLNQFRHDAEYVPLYFSLAAPWVLAIGLVAGRWQRTRVVWRDLGYLVGWLAVAIGLVGMVLHLNSRLFYERTIESLVYAAPFAAPLSYVGLGLLLIMNRMVDQHSQEWPLWIIMMALGGFAGNFVFTLTDHAQNGFFYSSEWVPVVSSAFAVGVLTAPLLTAIGRRYLWLCAVVMLVQAIVGVLGFILHLTADIEGPEATLFDKLVQGAPPFAPLLFPDLVVLASIGLWALSPFLPARGFAGQSIAESAQPSPRSVMGWQLVAGGIRTRTVAELPADVPGRNVFDVCPHSGQICQPDATIIDRCIRRMGSMKPLRYVAL